MSVDIMMHHSSISTAPSSPHRTVKRVRDYEAADSSQDVIETEEVDGMNSYKRRRDNNYTAPSTSQSSLLCLNAVNSRIAEICAFYEGKLKELNEQHEREAAKRNEELVQMQEQFNASTTHLTNENKLLKKAVCIQENKLKEAAAQQEQLKGGLQMAINKIEQLEATNNMLRSVIYNSNNNPMNSSAGMGGSGGHFPPGPPDVY